MTGFPIEDSFTAGSSEPTAGVRADSGSEGQNGHIWIISNRSALNGKLIQNLPSTIQSTTIFHTGQSALSKLQKFVDSQSQLSSSSKPQGSQKSSQQSVDLLFVATDLGDMSCIDFLDRIKNNYTDFAAPVVVVDGDLLNSSNSDNLSADLSLKEAVFNAGAIDYLSAPIIAAELNAKVSTFLRLGNTFPPASNSAILASNSILDNQSDERESAYDHHPGSSQQNEQLQKLTVENCYLRVILDNLPQQVFWKDNNLKFVGCNQRWANAVGIQDESEIIGKTDFDMVDNLALAQQFQSKDREVLETGHAIEESMEKAKIDQNGVQRWLDVTRQPLLDEKGNSIGIVGVINDVTKQRQAEEQLRLAEEKYRAIFENAVEGLFQASLEGRFISVNPALAQLYGYASPEEMIGEIDHIDSQIYVQSKRRQEILAYLDQFSELTDFESLVQQKDGQRIWVSESIRQVTDDSGDILYLEGSVKDVTEKRQAEMNLRKQRQQSERLLLNILPQMIAQRLKKSPGLVADDFSESTVLFADIVGFTEWASQIQVSELVTVLNKIFSEFDLLAEKIQIEKIKTIGDAYMAVSGVPIPVADHAERMAEMALEMQVAIKQFSRRSPAGDEPFRLRIGIHSGPVSAGVVGLHKFFYDLWGDTVNVASRMESQGTPGRIQVTHETYLLLRDRFELEFRGEFQIKGKGTMRTYWLLGRKPEGDSNNINA
ncbi:MAG: adenylate/guanylate cyclase domain-containing protein [Cyanophyceae cyanobacterium]